MSPQDQVDRRHFSSQPLIPGQRQVRQADDHVGPLRAQPARLRAGGRHGIAVAHVRGTVAVEGDAQNADLHPSLLLPFDAQQPGGGYPREGPGARIGDIAGDPPEGGFPQPIEELRLGKIELMVAEGGDVQAHAVQHRHHLPAGQALASHLRRAQGRRAQDITGQEREGVGVARLQALPQGRHPRQPAPAPVGPRGGGDLVDVVELDQLDLDGFGPHGPGDPRRRLRGAGGSPARGPERQGPGTCSQNAGSPKPCPGRLLSRARLRRAARFSSSPRPKPSRSASPDPPALGAPPAAPAAVGAMAARRAPPRGPGRQPTRRIGSTSYHRPTHDHRR